VTFTKLKQTNDANLYNFHRFYSLSNRNALLSSKPTIWTGMPSDLPTICRERSRLLREYTDAASGYSRSVHEMVELAISGEEVRANEARRVCRTTWDEAEKSRLALYRHEADHHCNRAADMRNLSES
jgi:hypothetical protein